MRCTAAIVADVQDGKRPDYEELRMAIMVQHNLLFLANQDIKHLIQGGWAATVTKKSYPKMHAELGISKTQSNAMKMDPIEFLGPANIPGTPEYEAHYCVSMKLYEKFKKEAESHEQHT